MRICFFIAACFFFCGGCQQKEVSPPIRPVRAMELEEEQWVRLHAFPGRTRAVDRVNLSFRVEGQIIDRPIYVGDEVLKGELLARLDPRDFEVNLTNALGRLEKAEADLRFAERDYKRALNIWENDPGAISQSLLDQKKEEENRLKGELKSLKAQVEQAEDQLNYTYLRSPYNGVIVAIYAQNYEYVNAKQPVLRLLNTSQVEMVIDVPENMIDDIVDVEKVLVEFDAIPGEEFPATIKEMGTEASTTTRTYPVTLLMKQPEDETIYAGMAGHAFLFSTKTKEFNKEGFLLPASALFTDNELRKSYVWVIDTATMTVQRKEVTKGQLTGQGMIIEKGLKEGEWVVTSGVNFLHEGQKVRIHPVKLNAEGQQVPAVAYEEA